MLLWEAVKCAIILFFRCKIVFIHFVLFLVFTLSDQTLSRYSDGESNGLHFLIFWKISGVCFYIRISSITDVKLKFVFKSFSSMNHYELFYTLLYIFILHRYVRNGYNKRFKTGILTIFSKVRRLDAKHLRWLIP